MKKKYKYISEWRKDLKPFYISLGSIYCKAVQDNVVFNDAYVNQSLIFLEDMPKYWLQLEPESKIKLHELLFPQGLVWENDKVTTPELSNIYSDIKQIANQGKNTWKTGDPNGIRTRIATVRGWCPSR